MLEFLLLQNCHTWPHCNSSIHLPPAVHSGCGSFYDPATFKGDIAKGCDPAISVAADPLSLGLLTAQNGDIVVASDGTQLTTRAGERWLLYYDTALKT